MTRTNGSTFGFARTATLLQARIRQAGESRGFAVSRLLTHWAEIVGADLAGIAHPVDVRYGRHGLGATLTVLTTGARAPELEMRKETLRERVNAAYGYNAIARVRITQTAPTGFAEPGSPFEGAPARKTREPSPATLERASRAADGVADDGLRAALESLARNVLSKSENDD